MKRAEQLLNLKWTGSKNFIKLNGFGFIEFATKFPSENIDIFTKLGFTVTGRHCSKNIFLLEQGEVKFVVDAEAKTDASSFKSIHGSGVCGVSFQVEDSNFAIRETVKRGAEAFVCKNYGLPAIRGIGGSKIYLIDSQTAELFFASFFEPTGEIPQIKSQVICIDHVTQNVFRGNMEAWVKFYQNVFNFQEIRYFDIRGKKTGLRSKALVSPCGKIRIPLNESQDEHSQIAEFLRKHNGEGVQHIALGCNDIYSVVGQIKDRGIKFQDTPDSYYDLIPKRIGDHQEDLAKLKQLRILIDGNNQEKGTLLQIFTKEIIGSVFFEFIERKGNKGFGEGNFQALFESIELDQIRSGVLSIAESFTTLSSAELANYANPSLAKIAFGGEETGIETIELKSEHSLFKFLQQFSELDKAGVVLSLFDILLYKYTAQEQFKLRQYQIKEEIRQLDLASNLTDKSCFSELLASACKLDSVEFSDRSSFADDSGNTNVNYSLVYFVDGISPEYIDALTQDHLVESEICLLFDRNSRGYIAYNRALFDRKFIHDLIRHFDILIQNVQNDYERNLEFLSLTSQMDISQQNDRLRTPSSDFGNLPVYVHFEKYAQKFPDSIAVTFGDRQVSYGELNSQANQLARYLTHRNVQPQDCVGVFIEPGIEIQIAILAIHKINAVYVPIDTEYPLGRIETVVQQVSPAAIICASDRQGEIDDNFEIDTINLSAIDLSEFDRSNLNYSYSADSISHIFFTSGTTGTPKGVVSSHSNLIHYIFTAQEKYRFGAEDSFLSATRYTFSISLLMMLLPLVCGGRVNIITLEQLLEPKLLAEAIEEVDFFHLGPSILQMLLDFLDRDNYDLNKFSHVKHASSGGDMIRAEILNRLNRVFPQAEVYAIYGSSEISCMGCTYFVPKHEIEQTLVGKPFNNVRLRVLDRDRRVVPIGVKGEIYFSGRGITQGYLNLPHRTETQYVWLDGERFYRTGDIGRLTPEGNLQMLGRNDNQTQIRGMRIELGEIESNLNLHPAISSCVVIVEEDKSAKKQLIAYVISVDSSLRTRELRSFLQSTLPQYMIPARFVFVEQFPLNSNGKVDRHALSLFNYWQQQLAGIPPLLELPTDRSRSNPAIKIYRQGTYKFHLSSEAIAQLQIICQESETTLFTILLASFATLLARYSNSQDIMIGSPMASHKHSTIDGVNILALRTNLEGDPSFTKLLSQVRQTTIDASAHSDIQFERLVEILQPEGSSSHNPLFQVMFDLQNQIEAVGETETSNSTITLPVDRATAECDLSLLIAEMPEGLVGSWQYNSDLFDTATIERLNGHFLTLLEGIVANPQQSISQLPLLTASERQLPGEWNDNYTKYPQDKCIHQLFEERVEQTPEAVAVVFEDKQLTYRELNQKANQLAHHLQSLGVGAEQLIGICVERSLETVISILGILKAGGAYIPLDPAYPSERIAYSLSDSQVRVLLTHQKHLAELPEHEAEVVCLDRDWQAIANHSSENLRTEVKSSNLAYVIYTSGSTGKPKGVLVPHGNVVRLFAATQDWYNFDCNDVWTLFHSYAFDFSVWELWGALIYGGKLVVVPYLVSRSADTFYQLLAQEGVTVLNQTPSAFLQLIQVEESLNITPKLNLRYVIFGGEALEFQSLRPWFERHGDRTPQLVNMYGITETTVHVTYRPITMTDLEQSSSLIGCLIPDLKLYLLDRYLQPVPIGVVGEMYIGGAGVARGYLNREKLTTERFINNPLINSDREKLYKSGDLARYLPNGELEYLGRIDNQVKIRGFRIELGEINAVLAQHPGVRKTVVIAREDVPGNKRLVAYFVATEPIHSSELRSFVQERLPNYMVPSAFVFLDTMPLTSNGKVDRRALPAPDTSNIQLESEFVPPSNPTEELLATIWADILGAKRIGIDDNFFELGGHSLLATQVISRCRQAFSVEVPLQSLFKSPTVATLAETIIRSQNQQGNLTEYQIIPLREEADGTPLSFEQQRLWFLDQLEPNSPFYNIPSAVKLSGDFNLEALQQALDAIVEHHQVIRTNYQTENGNPIQVVATAESVELSIVDLRQYGSAERETEVQRLLRQESQRPFNLASDLMLRGCLLQLAPQEHILLLVMHHIASDAWSTGILWEQLTQVYQAFLDGKPNPLKTLPIQYADYAVWQRKWLSGEVLDKQLNYWLKHLTGANPVLELPLDRPRPPVQTYRGASQSLHLPRSLSDRLTQLCRQEKVTLYMTLLTAFQTLLYRYSGQEDVTVGSPFAGRNRAEIEGLIGFFVNTVVLRSNLSGNPSFRKLLGRVRSIVLDAYDYQDLPFDKLVDELQIERDTSRNPLFQVWFNLLNVEDIQLDLPGIDAEFISTGETTSKFDLTLYVAEQKDGIELKLVYNADLFDLERMIEMLHQYHHLLDRVVENPQVSINDLSIVTSQTKLLLPNPQQELPIEWSESVQSKFTRQAQKMPQNLALVNARAAWTYRELDERANQLANYLLANNIQQQDTVAIYSQRSASLVWAILGVLKAGAAFVILDSAYPTSRSLDCLELVQPRAWIQIGVNELPTELQAYFDSLPDCFLQLPQDSKTVISDLLQDYSAHPPEITIDPDSLAYVAFTSGSTGKPKGILGIHRPLSHFVEWHCQTFSLDSSDKFSMLSGLSHDPLLRDIFTPLSLGATLYIPEQQDIYTPYKLADWMRQQQISIAHLTPAMAQLLTADTTIAAKDLRYLFFGGDILTSKDISKIGNFAPAATYVNFYGATETPQAMGYFVLHQGDRLPPRDTISLGRGIEGVQLLILNAKQQLAGIGELAEIYIRTPYLTKGYIGRENLTDERFVVNPFTQIEDDKLYKTGDLGRYLPDGNIEFFGRADNQVKIRGFRIELGEIEAVLAQHPDIRETVIIAREDTPGDKRLVAYVVAPAEPHSNDLRSFIKERLPNYMLPSAFVFLDIMPLTPNGKVDRRALPAPEKDRPESSSIAVPQDKLESHLIQIWESVLNVRPIGIQDNFFDLGGNSLQAVTLFTQIEKQFGKKLPLATLFQSSTVAEIAQIIRKEKWLAPWESLVPIQPNGTKPPLFYIHGGGGNLLVYRNLAHSLGSDQPVYGLQPRGLDGNYVPFTRIEDMAAYYLAQIRKLQPEGPYFLAGLSSGGTTAWEMAQLLKAQGQEVALLALFDTSGPNNYKILPPLQRLLSVCKWVTLDRLHKLGSLPQRLMQKLSQLGAKQASVKILENLGIAKKALSKDQKINKDKMQKIYDGKFAQYESIADDISSLEKRINSLSIFLLKRFSRGLYAEVFVAALSTNRKVSAVNNLDEISAELQQIQEANLTANRDYVASVYPDKAILFRASDRPPGFYRDLKLGWGDLAAGGMEVYEIPGNHTSIMQSPILAEKLKICLDKVQAE